MSASLLNLFNLDPEPCYINVKFEGRLLPIVVSASQTAQNLKISIENYLNIPQNSFFLMLNGRVLNNTAKIGLKAKKDSIISICFKLLGE